MHSETRILIDFIAAIGAGWVGGLLARACRLPLLVGYIAVGILIGPHFLRLISEGAGVQTMSELGVALLLFALGVELSLHELLKVKTVAIFGGIAQIAVTIGLGLLIGHQLGWPQTASAVLGFTLALSSTTVLVKVMSDRGEVHTQYAKVVMGINITQDLASIVLVGILPVLGSLSLRKAPELGLLLLKAGLFIAFMLFLAHIVVPRLLRLVSRLGNREIFLITVLVLCLAGAGLAEMLGLSLALGAFLSGMMISESDFHHETYSLVMPLRDIFGMLFFVSLGMFLEPASILRNIGDIGFILLALLAGKTLIIFLVVILCGYHLRTAMMSALALAQIGEFSFIIAQVAYTKGYLTFNMYGALIAAAILSMVLTPLFMLCGAPLYRLAVRFRPLRRLTRASRENSELAHAHQQARHVVLCGYGRVGRIVGEAMRHFHVPFVVIDYDQANITRLRLEGVSALYGDASSPVLLQQSGADHASVAVISLPESRSNMIALRHLKHMNPEMTLVARGVTQHDIDRAYAEGAEEVVEAEFECGLELARHTLLRLHYDPYLIQDYVDTVRKDRYRCELLQGVGGPPWI